ncbi:hypothetical protein [Kitasatospora viridis]|uniref:Uncharacterized protein n=1 Tax=Kitasatospora viridis TaxID=281105 RepID=A0A561SF78_9ACTN|nr:hypothetical protein [Kitasatospora viridis]TWF73457.1 hypothetical protein FHX73_1568 [Kitasatospora viridis]
MTGQNDLDHEAPTGNGLLGQVLSSGYLDSEAQYQVGRVLSASARSYIGRPDRQPESADPEELIEGLELIDGGWSRVRHAWRELNAHGKSRARERSAALDRAEGRQAKREAVRNLPSNAPFAAARAEFARVLAELADVLERYALPSDQPR